MKDGTIVVIWSRTKNDGKWFLTVPTVPRVILIFDGKWLGFHSVENDIKRREPPGDLNSGPVRKAYSCRRGGVVAHRGPLVNCWSFNWSNFSGHTRVVFYTFFSPQSETRIVLNPKKRRCQKNLYGSTRVQPTSEMWSLISQVNNTKWGPTVSASQLNLHFCQLEYSTDQCTTVTGVDELT